MTLDKWMTINYNRMLTSAIKISDNDPLAEELLHFCLESLIGKKNIQDILDSGGCDFYLIRMLMNNWRSTTSPFYSLYRKARISTLDCDIGELEGYTDKTIDFGDDNIRSKTGDDAINVILKISEREEYEETTEVIAELIREELETLSWYEQELFNLYLEENKNTSAISRLTSIPRKSIALTISRIKIHIANKIKNNYE